MKAIPHIKRLTPQLMRFAELVMGGMNLTEAWCQSKEIAVSHSAEVNAHRAWNTCKAVLQYREYLEEQARRPGKRVRMDVEELSEQVIAAGKKLYECAELSRQQIEALYRLHLSHGPTDLIDHDPESPTYLDVKPELSHLVQEYEVTLGTTKSGTSFKKVKVKAAPRLQTLMAYTAFKQYNLPPENDAKASTISATHQLMAGGNFPPGDPKQLTGGDAKAA